MTDATLAHHKIWPKRLPRELVVPQTSLCFNLDVAAARFPDKPACLFFGRALSYAQLKAQAEALAGCTARACARATAWRCTCRTARSSWFRCTASSVPTRWWCR